MENTLLSITSFCTFYSFFHTCYDSWYMQGATAEEVLMNQCNPELC